MGLKKTDADFPSRIKIVHVITDLDPGGAEAMLGKLLSVMDREVFDNRVVSLTTGGLIGERIKAFGWPVIALGMRKGLPSPAAYLRLVSFLKKEKPHILQSWLYHADLLAALAGRRMKETKLVWNIRCSFMDFSRYRPLTRWVVRSCARLSSWPDAVMVNSKAGREFHARLGYRPRRWEWIPNGFDLNEFRPSSRFRCEWRREHGLSEKDLLIGMIARFDPMKDLDTFLEAAVRLQEGMPEVSFVLVGRGLEENNPFFQRHPARRALGDRLLLLGYRSDIPRVLCALDLAVSTSLGEGFPNAVGEAMACGVPCVVTDSGDSAFLVGEGGSVVRPGDPEAIAAEWERLLRLSAEQRELIGKRGRKRIKTLFDLKVVVDRYQRFYGELISGKALETAKDGQGR